MKHVKLIGLISAIILAINFIIIGPAVPFITGANWFDTLSLINKSFVFPIAFIGFYLALYKFLQKLEINKLTTPVLIIFILGILKLMLNLVHFLGINIPDILNGLPGIVIMLVLIIWAFLVIRNKEKRFKRIRRFAIAMLVGSALVFILSFVSSFAFAFIYDFGYDPFEYINIAYAVYGIGYVFGLLIFVDELKNTNS
ncbi:hypothetical protein ACXR6G_06715 [Ancylomarina sp. YFZ004]